MTDDTTNQPPKEEKEDTIDLELLDAMTPPLTELDNDPRIPYIVENLRHVYDPEIPVNIYELGLIYEIRLKEKDHFHIRMTLTAPNCPVAGEMPDWIKDAALKADGVNTVEVELDWDPPWNPSLMAETAKLQLNMF